MFGGCCRSQPEGLPQNFRGASCTTKESQTRIIESVLRLPKNAKTTPIFLSVEGLSFIYQPCYRVPTIRIKRTRRESLTYGV